MTSFLSFAAPIRMEWRHGYAAWPSRSFQNGGSRCRTFHFFFIGIASTSEAKTTVSNSTQCELFMSDGKNTRSLEWPTPLRLSTRSIYLYICENCSSLWRYLSQGNHFCSILALDWSMCEHVSCFPLHTSRCTVAMTTTGSSCHSLMITRNNPWQKCFRKYINCWRFGLKFDFFFSSTFTFIQIATLCGGTFPRAILSVPFWRWIRTCASTCPVSPSTRHAAWLPWRPLTPAAIHWWLDETIQDMKALKSV